MRTDEQRFWSKVQKGPECWLWVGALNRPNGYGSFQFQGRQHQAHRVAYQWAIGRIPDGLQLDHLCRNRRCVNPGHLEVVTNRENVGRGMAVRITECPQGHPYDGTNTYLYRGWRYCRQCNREKARRRRAA